MTDALAGSLEALRQVRRDGLDAPVLILTAHDAAKLAAQALRAGANGFVLKQTAEELHTAIRELLQGRVYVTPSVSS